MNQKINITIPEPCHENWQVMSVVEKGRFCSSCQKNVHDFTHASDRKIIEAYEKDNHLCGRFLNTQLNRDLVKPKEKSSLWFATTSTIISFLALGTNEAIAQGEPKMVQTDKKGIPENSNEIITNQEKEISGVVSDLAGFLPGANVIVKGTEIRVYTNFDGKFTIKAEEGDVLVFSFLGMKEEQLKISHLDFYEIKMQDEVTGNTELVVIAGGVWVKPQNFFSRTFQKIGNLFK